MAHLFRTLENLYEDDSMIVINKPAGLLTIPDRYDSSKENLYSILKDHFGEIFIVHRLDKDTSGAIVFAKTPEAHRSLCIAFEERKTEKKYLAILSGVPREKAGVIDLSIAESPAGKGMMMVSKKGKEAITEYTVIESFNNFSLVEATLVTGRTHQIRVHFNALGFPLAVDLMYGKREKLFLSEIKKSINLGKEEEERPLLTRTALHSWKLTVPHPVTGEPVHVEAGIPKDLNAVINQLRKHHRRKSSRS
jgi:RluA family pseudouridine synthase